MTLSETELLKAFAGGVYFISPEELLSHNSGCLIEGLRELGVTVKANTARFTSRHASMPLAGVDANEITSKPFAGMSAVVIDITHANQYVPLESLRGGRLSYLTNSDTSAFCKIPTPHKLFAVHESALASNGAHRCPLAFGPTNGLIAASGKRLAFNKRKRVALRNFRATLSQGVRALLDLSYVPHLKTNIAVDDTVLPTHAYLESMFGSAVCLAYGGDFFSPIQSNPWFAEKEPHLLQAHSFDRIDAPALIMRWDSWRFWESLVGACVTVHLDFAKYGFCLPVMPEPWVHYAPIDLDDIKGSVTALMDHEKHWPAIAEAGRAWAIEHYAPKPTALRVLGQLL